MKKNKINIDDLQCYTIEDVMSILKVSRTTLYNLINDGEIKIIKMRNSTRITAEELERFIREN